MAKIYWDEKDFEKHQQQRDAFNALNTGWTMNDVPGNFIDPSGQVWGVVNPNMGADYQGLLKAGLQNGSVIEKNIPGFGKVMLNNAAFANQLHAATAPNGFDALAPMLGLAAMAAPIAFAGGTAAAGADGGGLSTLTPGPQNAVPTVGSGLTGGGFGAETGLGTWSALPGAAETAANSALLGEGAAAGAVAPFQPGFNLLDPSTYSGAGATSILGSLTGAAKTGLGNILQGSGSQADWLSVLGTLGATGLGVLGADKQQGAFEDVYNQQMALGAPSRSRFEGSFAPGFDLLTADPAIQPALDAATNSVLRGLSAQGGNPYDQPSSLAEAQKYVYGSTLLPQLNTYRSQNLTGGQLGTNTAGTASLAGAGQTGGMYDALGYGLSQLTNPQPTLQDLLKQLNGGLGGNYKLTF